MEYCNDKKSSSFITRPIPGGEYKMKETIDKSARKILIISQVLKVIMIIEEMTDIFHCRNMRRSQRSRREANSASRS